MAFCRQPIRVILFALIVVFALVACDATGGGTNLDTTAPTVLSTLPVDLAIDVDVNSDITATFSEAMDSNTIDGTSLVLTSEAGVVAGAVSYDATSMTALFNPTSSLEAGVSYIATIAITVRDEAGNALAETKAWAFTTSTIEDTTPPTVASTVPENSAMYVATDSDITATFSEAMNSTTINDTNFTLTLEGIGAVAGMVSYDALTQTAKFLPTVVLEYGETYMATITTAVTDLAGNALAVNEVWSFTTSGPDGGPIAVDLGTAANYAILAKTGVSNVVGAGTMITGNIGLSPAHQVALTGFAETMDGSNVFSTSTFATGQLFAADYTAPTPENLTTAVSNMQTAYTTAAGLTTPAPVVVTTVEIGGQTLVPGIYKRDAGAAITTDLTLFGSSTATWVFQIGTTLTVASGAKVILTGGALPENIFWQIGTYASLGTNSIVAGNLLTYELIALENGATVNGRLLAQTAVTLDANIVTKP